MNSRLGSIRHNSPRTSALRRDKYLQQAQYGMKDVVTKTEIEETDRNWDLLMDVFFVDIVDIPSKNSGDWNLYNLAWSNLIPSEI